MKKSDREIMEILEAFDATGWRLADNTRGSERTLGLHSTGSQIGVIYKAPACSRVNGTMPSSPDSNTMPCFPAYWAPQSSPQILDWFNKSLVSEVTVDPAHLRERDPRLDGTCDHRPGQLRLVANGTSSPIPAVLPLAMRRLARVSGLS